MFIHHNTLHAFEHLTFDEAVRAGSGVFGCEPFLSEDRYREELERDLGARGSLATCGGVRGEFLPLKLGG